MRLLCRPGWTLLKMRRDVRHGIALPRAENSTKEQGAKILHTPASGWHVVERWLCNSCAGSGLA